MKINPLSGKPLTTLQAAVSLQGTDTADQDKYRLLSQGGMVRDLKPMTFKRVQELSYNQFQKYPLARKLIELLMDFTTGDELSVKVKIKQRDNQGNEQDTERKEAQMVWDDFWCDPINNLEAEFNVIIQDLFLSGESVLPTFINTADGSVQLGYMDPAFIVKVNTNDLNQRRIESLTMRSPTMGEEREFKVVQPDNDPFSPSYGKLCGEAFYFRVNYVMSQKRGYSELTEYLDWLDAFEQFLFAVLKGFDSRNAFFFDVKMDGKSQEELDAMTVAPPRQGEVKLHNEKVNWEIKTPDLKAVDASAASRLIKNFITGTKGYPDMWFGDASQSNLATAQVMTAPTMRMLKRKQKSVKNVLKQMCQYVCDQAQMKNTLVLGVDEYIDIEVSMFDIERKDSAVIGSAFQQILSSLSIAVQNNWITNETAKKVTDGFIAMLGVETDNSETLESIKEDNTQTTEEDVLKTLPNINDVLNKNMPTDQQNTNDQ